MSHKVISNRENIAVSKALSRMILEHTNILKYICIYADFLSDVGIRVAGGVTGH